MPFYHFKCDACAETHEVLLPMGKSIRKCPKCGGKVVRAITNCVHIDLYSPMHPRRGRGHGGAGRVNPGNDNL